MPRRPFSPLLPLIAAAFAAAAACEMGETPSPDDGPGSAPAEDRSAGATTVVDTLRIDGEARPVRLQLFHAPQGFPLRFTSYVPGELEPEVDERGVRFTAGRDDDAAADAFLHLFVFPPGTSLEEATASAKAYKTGRGIPVGQGLEPVASQPAEPTLIWAVESFRFRYQDDAEWYAGSIGVGRHQDRFFQIVRHRPARRGEAFSARADLVLETWRWADGSRLMEGRPPEP